MAHISITFQENTFPSLAACLRHCNIYRSTFDRIRRENKDFTNEEALQYCLDNELTIDKHVYRENKTTRDADAWAKAISQSFNDEREKNARLEPNKDQVRYIRDWARNVHKHTEGMDHTWLLLESKFLAQEDAQKTMDFHKKHLVEAIQNLIIYAQLDKEEIMKNPYQ